MCPAAAPRGRGALRRPSGVRRGRRLTLTFAELLERVRATAARLPRRGLEPGDRVVLWAPNSIDWVVAALATSYAGGTLVPANSRYTGHEVADLVERTDAVLVVVADGFLGPHPDRRPAGRSRPRSTARDRRHPRSRRARSASGHGRRDRGGPAAAVSPDDVADILFTSGTTGTSEGRDERAPADRSASPAPGRSCGGVTARRPLPRGQPVLPLLRLQDRHRGRPAHRRHALPGARRSTSTQTMRLIESRADHACCPGAPTIFQSLLDAPGRVRARPVLAAARGHRRRRRPGRADRADAGATSASTTC